MRGLAVSATLGMMVIVLGIAWPCAGQATPGTTPADPPPSASAPEESDGDARFLFQQGRAAYDEGEYEEALALFRRAHSLSGRVELLYNIGLAAERLREDRQALAAYEAYLEHIEDDGRRAAIEARIQILTQSIADAEADEERQDAAGSRSVMVYRDRDRGPGALPWVVAGTGVAFLAGGLVLIVLAYRDIEQVEEAEPATRWSAVEPAYDRAPILSTVGFVLSGVGIAGAAGGILWAALADEELEEPAIEVGLDPGGVRLRGRF